MATHPEEVAFDADGELVAAQLHCSYWREGEFRDAAGDAGELTADQLLVVQRRLRGKQEVKHTKETTGSPPASHTTDLFGVEVADPLSGSVALVSHLGAVIQEEVRTPAKVNRRPNLIGCPKAKHRHGQTCRREPTDLKPLTASQHDTMAEIIFRKCLIVVRSHNLYLRA